MDESFESNKLENARKFFANGLNEFERVDYIAAEKSFIDSLKLAPNRLSTLTNLIATLLKLNKFTEANYYLEHSLNLYPNDEVLHLNQGLFNLKQRKLNYAITSFDTAIRINPRYAEAFNNKGFICDRLNELSQALQCFTSAIEIDENYIEAYYNRGNLYLKIRKYELAMHDFEKCIVINPNYEDLIASYLATKMQICDWDGVDKFLEIIKNNIIKYKAITSPFRILSIVDSPELHKEAAIIYAESEIPEDNSLGNFILPARNKKIKVGYYSADFHNHATSYLMVEIFELHDKNNFEIVAFSFGPNTNDTMRIRVSNSFDHFYDVSNMSDYEIAKFSRNIGIDIAVDLKGYTEGQRAGIFAKKCAPIQINYLGYPGTMGSDLYDYIIADKKIIPENQIKNYIEKIVFLPDSYQPNDSKKVISARKFSKKELGLPENSFVYCCFNNTYKILPEIFNIWMKILLDVPNSVLWLINDNHISVDNLRKNAIKKNINPERLIFADRIPLDEHLARHKFADLFLDTFPYNAHTTTSDALWACLPVLTISGKSFASRVSASLLTTSGLNNFVTTSYVEYEEKAINLASNQRTLSEARKTLSNQLDNPLFDSKLYTINLEKGYYEIYNNYLLGFKSKHIYV